MSLRPDFLSALAAFESAARHQNFAHAGEELHLTASAVSHHVRKLESRLGVTLFQRHARGVSLTDAGRQLADSASSAMADMEAVLGGLRAGEDHEQRLRISTLHSLLYTWLMPRLHRFTPGIRTVRLSFDTEVALTRFEEGSHDLAIRHGPGHWAGLTAHHLMDDALFPVASPRLPGLAEVKTPADVARLPLINDLARQGWHDWLRAAGVHGAELPPAHVFSDTTDAFEAAAQGLGAALAREKIVQPWLDDGRLLRLPGPRCRRAGTTSSCIPRTAGLRSGARAFLDWLLEDAAPEEKGARVNIVSNKYYSGPFSEEKPTLALFGR
jgi:DNA-binding transcriptional LysR family regulator